MNRQLITVFGLALLMVPVVVAQIFTFTEDFEDDTIGQPPSGDFYAFDEVAAPVSGNATVQLYSGDQALQFRDNGATGNHNVYLRVNTGGQPLSYAFDVTCDTTVSGNDAMEIDVLGESDQVITKVIVSRSGTSPPCRLIAGGTTDFSDFATVVLSFDWSGQTINRTVDGVPKLSSSFDNPASTDGGLRIYSGSGTNCFFTSDYCGLYFDDWNINYDITPPVVVEEPVQPEEFSQAIRAMLEARGFISSESQVLFVLVVAGILTVLASLATVLMQSGLLKNIVIMAPGDLVIFSSAFILDVPDWMVLVSLTLGVLFIMGAPREARNTYHEVVANLRRGGAIAADAVRNTLPSRGQARSTNLDRFIRRESTGSDVIEGPDNIRIDRGDITPDEPAPESVEAVRESIDLLDDPEGEQ